MTEKEMSEPDCLSVFENLSVGRAVATWSADDGSVKVKTANPATEGIAVPAGLVVSSLSTVTIVAPDQLHVNAATLKTPDELAKARDGLKGPLNNVFLEGNCSAEQKACVLQLGAKRRPVISPSCMGGARNMPNCTSRVSTGALTSAHFLINRLLKLAIPKRD